MAYVEQKFNDENFESLYKRFKRKVNDEKIIKEFKKHEFFLSSNEKKK